MLILTSSFGTIADELRAKNLLPASGKVAFITTAADPYPEHPWIDNDRSALARLGFEITEIDIKNKTSEALERELVIFDIIFVAGGNTHYLAHHAHLCNFQSIVRSLLAQNKLYIGSSAGSVLAGPSVEPFVKEDMNDLPKDFVVSSQKGLNLVDYVILPHYQVPAYAEEFNRILETYKDRFTFVKLTDEEYRIEK